MSNPGPRVYEPRGRVQTSRVQPAGRLSPWTSSDSRSGTPSLRRVNRFDQIPGTQPRSASADAAARPGTTVRFVEGAGSGQGTKERRTTSTSGATVPEDSKPHRSVRISQGRASAILYTLEEALRNPKPFSDDVEELNAPMSDLTRGAGGTSGPTSRTYGGTERATPGQASASAETSRIRTPRQILNARQARQRGEQDASRRDNEAEAVSAEEEKQLAEQETQRRIDLERRRSAERRANAAGLPGQQRDSGYRTAGSTVGGRTPGSAAYNTPTVTAPGEPVSSGQYVHSGPYYPNTTADPSTTGGRSTRARGAATAQQLAGQAQQMPPSSSYAQQPYSQSQLQPQTRASAGASYPPSSGQSAQPQPTAQSSIQPQQQPQSSFPHAFERWEQLSATWEGITSSLVRKLESEVARSGPLPPDQAAMSRQITDLSAAGANLFHAVVELQRLRASSERKFQRWFFETRSQQEAYTEEIARLERDNEITRSDLEQARGQLQTARVDPSVENRLQEARRELNISKWEAKRAWEELGRREEKELIQQQDLREGKAVFVGGVQVLPSSVVSRGASLRQPGTGDIYSTQTPPGAEAYQYQEPSPTDTDPFTESRQRAQPMYASPGQPGLPPSIPQPQQTTQMPRGAAPGPSGQQGFYTQPQTFLHEQRKQPQPPIPSRSAGSESVEDDPPELDQYGNIRFDQEGRPIPFRGVPSTNTEPIPSIPTTFAGGGGGTPGMPSSSMTMPPPPIPPSALRQERQQTQPLDPPEVISSPESSEPEEDDDYDAHQRRRAQRYTQAQTQGGVPAGSEVSPADYEGEGFGSGQGWEEMESSRHHHPTRLSDVMEEEDERSRTSRGSPGQY